LKSQISNSKFRKLVIGCCVLALFHLSAPAQNNRAPARLASAEGWRQAAPGYRFAFPRDHGSHPPYRIEWWYYTGNLESADGRRFGYQLTFFRTGVVVEPAIKSRWAVRDLYLAHFAVSDIEAKSFHSFERINRAGVGWAGAETDRYRVWNEDWQARLDGNDHMLKATEGGFEIDLRLTPARAEVIHGENGLSQKGGAAGNASYYYSVTRFEVTGSLVAGGERFAVKGSSWMDHEFGTSFLEPGQMGWDWFSIQLDDGRDLMLFQLRRSDGSIDPRSSGTLIDREGRATHIPFGTFTLAPAREWRSPESRAAYPVAWTIDLADYGLKLDAQAAFDDQELRATESTGVTYWEGSIRIEGTAGNQGVTGRGYLEMTGYAGQSMGEIMR
jgi:predicted secreted hydrolase